RPANTEDIRLRFLRMGVTPRSCPRSSSKSSLRAKYRREIWRYLRPLHPNWGCRQETPLKGLLKRFRGCTSSPPADVLIVANHTNPCDHAAPISLAHNPSRPQRAASPVRFRES